MRILKNVIEVCNAGGDSVYTNRDNVIGISMERRKSHTSFPTKWQVHIYLKEPLVIANHSWGKFTIECDDYEPYIHWYNNDFTPENNFDGHISKPEPKPTIKISNDINGFMGWSPAPEQLTKCACCGESIRLTEYKLHDYNFDVVCAICFNGICYVSDNPDKINYSVNPKVYEYIQKNNDRKDKLKQPEPEPVCACCEVKTDSIYKIYGYNNDILCKACHDKITLNQNKVDIPFAFVEQHIRDYIQTNNCRKDKLELAKENQALNTLFTMGII